MFLSIFISIFLGPYIISCLKKQQLHGQPIRSDGPQTHKEKAGTPTMGGVMIVGSTIFSALICCDLTNHFVQISILVFLAFALLGFIDDYLKLSQKNHYGVKARHKFIFQLIVSLAVYFMISKIIPLSFSKLYFPIFKNYSIDLGLLFLPFTMIVISGSSNAVNLTDGLDGLAIVPVCIATACFALIAYFAGVKYYANYLHILHIPGTAELSVLCSGLIGSSLGFLWFNAKPAEIFMGDTGSLALGGFLGIIAILTKQEIMLAIIGAIFVIEALSVIMQVAYFRFTGGKRIFRMAPIHHHFEKAGMAETKVVTRFWIISLIFAIIALILLKVR